MIEWVRLALEILGTLVIPTLILVWRVARTVATLQMNELHTLQDGLERVERSIERVDQKLDRHLAYHAEHRR